MKWALNPELCTKAALRNAVNAGQTVIAHDPDVFYNPADCDCRLKEIAAPDGQITITRNTGYPAYNLWYATLTIKDGKVVEVT